MQAKSNRLGPLEEASFPSRELPPLQLPSRCTRILLLLLLQRASAPRALCICSNAAPALPATHLLNGIRCLLEASRANRGRKQKSSNTRTLLTKIRGSVPVGAIRIPVSLAGWLTGWLAGWLVGWLADIPGCLAFSGCLGCLTA
jgi:hypothetical protein